MEEKINNENNTEEKKKQFLTFNMDYSRIFWIGAIVLLFIVFIFLLGYWLGNNFDQDENVQTFNLTTQELEENPQNTQKEGNGTEEKVVTQENIDEENIKADFASMFEDNETIYDIEKDKEQISKNNESQKTKETIILNKDEDIQKSSSTKANIQTKTISAKEPRNNDTLKQKQAINEKYNGIKPIVSYKNLETERGIDKDYRYITGPCTIQVATHTNEEMANKIKDILMIKNFNSYIDEITAKNGKKLYKIKIGKYKSVESAKRTLRKLIQNSDIKDIEKSIIVGIR